MAALAVLRWSDCSKRTGLVTSIQMVLQRCWILSGGVLHFLFSAVEFNHKFSSSWNNISNSELDSFHKVPLHPFWIIRCSSRSDSDIHRPTHWDRIFVRDRYRQQHAVSRTVRLASFPGPLWEPAIREIPEERIHLRHGKLRRTLWARLCHLFWSAK